MSEDVTAPERQEAKTQQREKPKQLPQQLQQQLQQQQQQQQPQPQQILIPIMQPPTTQFGFLQQVSRDKLYKIGLLGKSILGTNCIK